MMNSPIFRLRYRVFACADSLSQNSKSWWNLFYETSPVQLSSGLQLYLPTHILCECQRDIPPFLSSKIQYTLYSTKNFKHPSISQHQTLHSFSEQKTDFSCYTHKAPLLAAKERLKERRKPEKKQYNALAFT